MSLDGQIMLAAKPHAFAGAVLCPNHAKNLTPSLCLEVTTALVDRNFRKTSVPYTLWISEAWKHLFWAEPSAALFWEMATMYHTLFLAATDFQDPAAIPPILSCGSTSSMGSGNTHHTGSERPTNLDKKKYSTAASAKELPVWLVGSFLLLHCEERAFHRNLSGEDDRRFLGGGNSGSDAVLNAQGKVDFTSLLKHPSLSPRTRLHAEWSDDNSNCTVYLLRHLRKCLLLTAVSHNPDAVHACDHLASIQSPPPQPLSEKHRRASYTRFSADEIRRQHDSEHGNVGLNVRLTMEDLERLNFLFQPPSGGGIDDPPLKIGERLWTSLYSSTASPTGAIPIGDVEREIRRHLELELIMAGSEQDDKEDVSTDEDEVPSSALASLSLYEKGADGGSERAKQPQQGYHKELSYIHLRGTTILLKPTVHDISSGASTASADHAQFLSSFTSTSRLHDLVISDCSDVHMYLLQPFEHVTIAGCTGCTIVVGAVAGLLHVVDCEKTTITSASRRLLISNCSEVVMCVFTPSPPLLVGDNRNCQLAPYNTYYDGIREDLLATGLAAATISENQSPHHGGKNYEMEPGWPPLQCASNKWKQPVELSKLEPPVSATNSAGGSSPVSGASGTASGASRGADDKAVSGGKPGSGNDSAMYAPVLLPPSEFNILFVPIESEASRQRRADAGELNDEREPDSQIDSQYCRLLAEVLQLSPFSMPVEYERRALVMAERMRTIQQKIQKTLTPEQRIQFEEELNRGFRDWLVTSGNLRQVLDLVHLERRGAV